MKINIKTAKKIKKFGKKVKKLLDISKKVWYNYLVTVGEKIPERTEYV